MKKDIKEKWVAALRSDEFKQGRDRLGGIPGGGGREEFCCLGVLCELAAREGIVKKDTRNDPDTPDTDDRCEYGYGIEFATSALPAEVQEWAGVGLDDPHVEDGGDREVALSCLNDMREMSFLQIANRIEKSELL